MQIRCAYRFAGDCHVVPIGRGGSGFLAMTRRFFRIASVAPMIAVIITTAVGVPVSAQVVLENDSTLQKMDVVEHLGDTIPMDIPLIDDAGRARVTGDYFQDGRPVLLILGYYSCPMLCNLVLNGATEAAKKLSWMPGKEYHILYVSIDPLETAILAAAKKENYVENFGRSETSDGWTFCVTSEADSRRLADAVGFRYFYDARQKQYAHPAVLTILTGRGVVSRYLYGIEFKERDMKMALLEASSGRIGTTLDRIILYCYHYDPEAGGYVVMAGNVMKLGGGLTLVGMALFLAFLWWREQKRKTVPSAVAGHKAE